MKVLKKILMRVMHIKLAIIKLSEEQASVMLIQELPILEKALYDYRKNFRC